MNNMKNAINWFEIPAKDFDRSKRFYEEVLQAEMQVMQMDPKGAKWAFFPFDMEKIPSANFTGAELYRCRLHAILEDRTLFGPNRAACVGTDERLARAELFEPPS